MAGLELELEQYLATWMLHGSTIFTLRTTNLVLVSLHDPRNHCAEIEETVSTV